MVKKRQISQNSHGSTKVASGTFLQQDHQHCQVQALELQHTNNASIPFENVKSENSDDKVKKLEKFNHSLNANLEEAILELKDKSKTIYELNEKTDILLGELVDENKELIIIIIGGHLQVVKKQA